MKDWRETSPRRRKEDWQRLQNRIGQFQRGSLRRQKVPYVETRSVETGEEQKSTGNMVNQIGEDCRHKEFY